MDVDPGGTGDLRQLSDRHRRSSPASIRHPRHVVDAAMIGADVVTPAPRRFSRNCCWHPLTRSRAGAVPGGLEQARGAREGVGLTYSSASPSATPPRPCRPVGGPGGRVGLWRRAVASPYGGRAGAGPRHPERALAELPRPPGPMPTSSARRSTRSGIRHDVMAHIHHLGEQAPAAAAVHPPRRDERVRHGPMPTSS